jgi:hypothetical protein
MEAEYDDTIQCDDIDPDTITLCRHFNNHPDCDIECGYCGHLCSEHGPDAPGGECNHEDCDCEDYDDPQADW